MLRTVEVCMEVSVCSTSNTGELLNNGKNHEYFCQLTEFFCLACVYCLVSEKCVVCFCCSSYLDYAKIVVFYFSFWITLLLLFITGTSRISLFCMGYLIICFVILWFGQDLLLKPTRSLLRLLVQRFLNAFCCRELVLCNV